MGTVAVWHITKCRHCMFVLMVSFMLFESPDDAMFILPNGTTHFVSSLSGTT